jgi:hypothetical protein
MDKFYNCFWALSIGSAVSVALWSWWSMIKKEG